MFFNVLLGTEGLSLNGDFSRGVQTSPTNVTVPEEAAKASDTCTMLRTLPMAVAFPHFVFAPFLNIVDMFCSANVLPNWRRS